MKSKSSTSFFCVVILVASLAILAGCGGTGGGNFISPPPPPDPTLKSIAVTPAAPSVAAGTKQQFTATATYSDSSTKDLTSSVTWASSSSATATISSSGMAQAVAAGTATITATSGTVNGSAKLTVTAAQPPPPQSPTVTSITPTIFWLDQEAIVGTVAAGNNLTSTTTACTGSTLELLGQTFVNANKMSVAVGFDTPHFTANVYDVGADDGSGCSSQRGKFFFAGNQNTVAVTKSGEVYYRDPGAGLVYRYKIAGDTLTADGTPFTGNHSHGTIAFDDDANILLLTEGGGGFVATYNPDGTFIQGMDVTGHVVGVASAHGNGCAAQPNEGLFVGFDVNSGAAIVQSTGTASQPWAVTTVELNSGSQCVGYTRGDETLHFYSLVTMAPQGAALPLKGLASGGDPLLVAFNGNSTVKGTVVLFNQADNNLVAVDLASGMPSVRWTKPLPSSATSAPVRILADDVGARVIAIYANPQDANGKITQAKAVDVASGTISPMDATSTVAPGAAAISPANDQLMVFGGKQSAMVPNN